MGWGRGVLGGMHPKRDAGMIPCELPPPLAMGAVNLRYCHPGVTASFKCTPSIQQCKNDCHRCHLMAARHPYGILM